MKIRILTTSQIKFLEWILINANNFNLSLLPKYKNLDHGAMECYIGQILKMNEYHEVNAKYLNIIGERYKDEYKYKQKGHYE